MEDESRIVYDDKAISQLLDRTKEGQEEKEIAMNNYFSSFKVANYMIIDLILYVSQWRMRAELCMMTRPSTPRQN